MLHPVPTGAWNYRHPEPAFSNSGGSGDGFRMGSWVILAIGLVH
jgi:hypothetical protein